MTARRYGAVGLWLACLSVCLVLISQTTFKGDLSAFLPRSPSPSEQVLVEQLRDGAVSRVILLGIEGAPVATLTSVSRSFAEKLRALPDFTSVNNGESLRQEQDQAYLWDNRYVLSSAVTPDHFSEAGLKTALQMALELLNSSAAPLVKSFLPRDPTGEMLHLFDALTPAAQPASEDGIWVSEDAKTALMVLQSASLTSDVDAQQAGLARMRAAFAAARRDTAGAESVRLVETGPVVFSVATRDRIKGDAVRLSAIATLLVATLLLFVYRSLPVLVFGLLPVLSGAIAGIAAVSLAYGEVHSITLGFGVTLIGEAVDYPIYLFTQTIPGTQPRDTLRRIWPTLRLGVLTSVCGFSVMLLSSFDGLAQLGAFSIAGLIAAVAVTRYVVPVLLPAGFQSRRPAAIGAALRRVLSALRSLRLPAYVAVAAALGLLAAHAGTLWDDELASLSPISAADKLADQRLRSQLGAPDAGYLLIVNGASQEEVLQRSEALSRELQSLTGQNLLEGFQSASAFLPSLAAQEQRRNAIPPRAELAANVSRAQAGLPFRQGSFDPFLDEAVAAKTRPPLDRASLAETSFGALVDTLLIARGESWRALLPLRGVKDPARLAQDITRLALPGVVFLDIKRDSDALYRAYRQQAVALSLGGVAAILLLLAVSLKSLRRVARVAAPLAFAVAVTAAILLLLGQRLTIFHFVGLLLAVAVGSNYALFFERENRAGEAGEWIVASLALANLSTAIGFGVLSLSQVPVLYGIGMTVAIGTVLSLGFSSVLSRPVG